MSTTFVESTNLTTMTCGACGILFAVPETWKAEVRHNKSTFYCPNGHPRVFRKSEEDELREKLEFERKRVQWAQQERDGVKRELEHQKFKTMAERSAKARLKKRIANGVCPCCHRTFNNLKRHMASKHPEEQSK